MTTNTFKRSNVYKDFDLSFTKHPLTGDIGVKRDINSINQSLKTLISTNYGERPFQPQIGCSIRGILFEVVDPITILNLKTVIQETITNYEPRVNLKDIRVVDNSERNSYGVTIVYSPNMTQEVVELEVVLQRLR